MKYISCVCLISTFIGFIFVSYVYATPLDDEAKKKLKDYYMNSGMVECGDSWFVCFCKREDFFWLAELKGVSLYVIPIELTYADQLNQIEWKGYGGMTVKAARKFFRDKGWSEWWGNEGTEPSPDSYVVKKNGKWIVSPTKPPPPGTI